MKIEYQSSDASLLGEIGARVAAVRLERNLTQAVLAKEAGVSKRTVERLESGQVGTRLAGFLRVCRVLGLLERFEQLIPAPSPSPIRYRSGPRLNDVDATSTTDSDRSQDTADTGGSHRCTSHRGQRD